MIGSAPFKMSHKHAKLPKRGKRSDACLRRYHVVTAGFDKPSKVFEGNTSSQYFVPAFHMKHRSTQHFLKI